MWIVVDVFNAEHICVVIGNGLGTGTRHVYRIENREINDGWCAEPFIEIGRHVNDWRDLTGNFRCISIQ